MSRLEMLLNKKFAELSNEEIAELVVLLKAKDIDVEVIDAETFEAIQNIFKEEDSMNNTAATIEEVTMGEKAKAFAEASKEKLSDGFKYVVNHIEGAAEEVKNMANMNDKELEEYIKTNGKSTVDRIINAIKDYSDKMRANSDLFPSLKLNADKADNVVELIKAVLGDTELTGWGKFKAIVKELIGWVLRLFLKVGAIVLKLAFTIAVGTIKIGAIALVTTGKVIGVANKEIIKPTVKAGKRAWNNHKIHMAKAEAEREAEFDDIEDELFEV